MTEVEALLAVDGGQVPPGVQAFRARDRDAPTRRFRLAVAIGCAVAAAACGFSGIGREIVALLLLGAGIFGVLASPDAAEDDDEQPSKPATLLLTPTGLIVRDAFGLRCWRFGELADVRQITSRGETGLLIVCQDGSSDFVDTGDFERGESLWALVQRLVPRPVPAPEQSPDRGQQPA